MAVRKKLAGPNFNVDFDFSLSKTKVLSLKSRPSNLNSTTTNVPTTWMLGLLTADNPNYSYIGLDSSTNLKNYMPNVCVITSDILGD